MDSKILTMFNQGKHEEAIQAAVKAIDAAPDAMRCWQQC